ncbi:MAG: YkvA family protein [Phormidium sp.]
MQVLKQKFRQLKRETYTIYLACKDPRVPWYAKVLASCVVAYAFSPIDLIPDFIPIIGYLDDLLIVPLGIVLVLKMIPKTVIEECRQKAELTINQEKPTSWTAAVVIVIIWLLVGVSIAIWIGKIWKR